MDLAPEILEGIEKVRKYFGDESDWIVFKKEVLKTLNPAFRTFFSTRDPKTKKQSLNDFEKEVIAYWHQLTGITLVLKS